jgi:hypothetical protein
MKLIIVKTNIKNKHQAYSLGYLFTISPAILDWSVDLEDKDKVLRILAKDFVEETDIMGLLTDMGHKSEKMPD